MLDFVYNTPTTVYFGKDKEKEIGKIIKGYGYKKIMMQYGKESIKKSCQRCFQAIRIDVNGEFDALYSLMEKLPEVLAPNGRVAILTFHSGEDRLVKKAFQTFYRQGVYSDAARDVIRPSAEECVRNSRAKSTKMRWAIRSDLE